MAANAISGPHGRDIAAAEAGSTAPARNAPLDALSFGDVLEAINPLQYVPVVGSIYRVVTGDRGSPGLRTAVSMVTGMLTGPVGLLTSIVGTLAEHFFHFEEAARSVVVASPPPAAPAEVRAPEPVPPAVPASVARRAVAAYALADAATVRVAWGGRER